MTLQIGDHTVNISVDNDEKQTLFFLNDTWLAFFYASDVLEQKGMKITANSFKSISNEICAKLKETWTA